ncbi:unnamed protein product [Moneuplotes crassus]|uniref:Uncharacterized protein n=1 Tax=Euplotes crassus TaxID=5936 RepID=A0AAD1UCT1_EUPCR|nr:unnamed protein product [Moneuplotes crassus]
MEEDKENKSHSRNLTRSGMSLHSHTANEVESRKLGHKPHLFELDSQQLESRGGTSFDSIHFTDKELEIQKLKELEPEAWRNIPKVVKEAFNIIITNLCFTETAMVKIQDQVHTKIDMRIKSQDQKLKKLTKEITETETKLGNLIYDVKKEVEEEVKDNAKNLEKIKVKYQNNTELLTSKVSRMEEADSLKAWVESQDKKLNIKLSEIINEKTDQIQAQMQAKIDHLTSELAISRENNKIEANKVNETTAEIDQMKKNFEKLETLYEKQVKNNTQKFKALEETTNEEFLQKLILLEESFKEAQEKDSEGLKLAERQLQFRLESFTKEQGMKLNDLQEKIFPTIESKINNHDKILQQTEHISNNLQSLISERLKEVEVKLQELQTGASYTARHNQKFEQIDSKFQDLNSEVNQKIESVNSVVDNVRKEVIKIDQQRRSTEEQNPAFVEGLAAGSNRYQGAYGAQDPHSTKTISQLRDMKNYLEYNKEYNQSIERKRVERKSKAELDSLVIVKERTKIRNKSSKSAEKYSNLPQVHKLKNLKLFKRNDMNQTMFSNASVRARDSLKVKRGDMTHKGRALRNSLKKITPKNLASAVEFTSLKAIERNNYN